MAIIIFDAETTGLAPIECLCKEPREIKLNRILSLVVWDLESNDKKCFYGEDEKLILNEFAGFLSTKNCNQLIGFNCEFDLNFIRVRSFINNIKLPNNFKDIKITDLRKVLNSNEYAHGKLNEYAELIGIKAVTENGKSMPMFYETKQWDKIKEHNLEDLELTKLLYQRCKDCNLI